MWKYHHIVLCLLFLWNDSLSFHTHFTDFYLESVEIPYLNPKLIFAYANASLKRREHEYPTVSVDADFVDALRNYDADVKIYYSPLGNQRFILLPFKFERQPICKLMEYKPVLDVVKRFSNSSNIPQLGNQTVQFCELFTVGHYYLHNFMIDKSVFPRFTPTGRYRWIGLAYHRATNKVVQGLQFVATFV